MPIRETVVTILEIAATVALIVGFIFQDKLVAWEDKVIAKIKKFIKAGDNENELEDSQSCS